MNRQSGALKPDVGISGLAYELNTVALKVAAEAEQLLHQDKVAVVDGLRSNTEIAARIHGLINQLHDAVLALRYVRHNGQMPPRWSNFN